ncbi:MAG: hypothetical protein EHM21_02240 [Chloroflexi bacterium]|nr:MAG: hypothetical protein EHM21_02240 [Chloroflexota bacterium]
MPAFHLARYRNRDCLIDPQGRPFFSLGVVHTAAYLEEQGQEAFLRRYGGDWARLSAKIAADLKGWNFNTAGYHHPPALRDHLPFLVDCYPAEISYWMGQPAYPDVFDPAFEIAVSDLLERTSVPVREHPNLIGYYWTDTPRWDLERARVQRALSDPGRVRARSQVGTDWVSAIRALPATAPGKQRYAEYLLRSIQETGGAAVYLEGMQAPGTNAELTLHNLAASTFPRLDLAHPLIARNDRGFLRRIARQYYSIVGQAARRADPHHLLFGDRYLTGDHPPEVLEEAAPYIDVISFQPYGSTFDRAAFDHIHTLTGKPILICDHAINFPTPQHPRTLWPQRKDEAEASEAYREYLLTALDCPYIIGYHRCQYIDRALPSGEILKQGLLKEDESPYPLMTARVKEANGKVLEAFRADLEPGRRISSS